MKRRIQRLFFLLIINDDDTIIHNLIDRVLAINCIYSNYLVKTIRPVVLEDCEASAIIAATILFSEQTRPIITTITALHAFY
ncbi:MAG: hypothetical protein Q8Q49_06115 [bacterium]|nr:hypothetical protein [bacterium]